MPETLLFEPSKGWWILIPVTYVGCGNLFLGASSESSGGGRRLAKINKVPSPSSGSTSSTGSSGGKEKLKKVTGSSLVVVVQVKVAFAEDDFIYLNRASLRKERNVSGLYLPMISRRTSERNRLLR